MALRSNESLGGTHDRICEKLLAIRDDFWIETADGRRAFNVDGKALRLRATYVTESPSGEGCGSSSRRSHTGWRWGSVHSPS